MTRPPNLLDDETRTRIEDLARRMDARPGDVPELGFVRDDGFPSCWQAPDGSWHLMSRERGQVISDRVATDREEFVRIVAEQIAEMRAHRLHEPGTPGFRRAAWQEQFDALGAVDRGWARQWLDATRTELISRGADAAVLDGLPSAQDSA